MKLHSSAIEEIVSLCDVHGGTPDNVKLKKILADIDFTPYEQKSGNQDMILVLTKRFIQELNAAKVR